MRLPATAHTSQGWRIHEIAPEFRLEDVWELRWRGGPEEFTQLIEMITSGRRSPSGASRVLWAIRSKLGAVLGWDDPGTGVGSRVPSLRERLPEDLRDRPAPQLGASPFSALYLLEDEFAAELANATVHGVLHIGRVPDGASGFRAQMAVLVNLNGRRGTIYLAAIKPFRHLIIYPALLRQWERAWQRRSSAATAAGA